MFKQRMWMFPAAQWLGLLSGAYAIWLLTGGASLWWLLAWAVGHTFGGIAVSAGLHRYFTHGAFQTTRFWHNILALYATLTVQDSPVAWAGVHTTHHVHSDKPGDPHYTGFAYLLRKHYLSVPLKMRRVRQVIQDPTVRFVHRNAVLIIAAWISLLLLVGLLTGTGVLPLVFGYLAPLGSTQTFGAIHQVTSHRGGNGAKDMPWMEWILPAAGEWMHKHHHDHPRDPRMGTKWWNLDYGYWFICLIRTDR
jgi:stearoyl-CoA desaturase (delta-9 desaturase)